MRDLRYPRDPKSALNQKFLDKIRSKKPRGVTSIFNILEVCGILSHNLSPSNLFNLYADFCRQYQIQVFFPSDPMGNLEYDVSLIFQQIMKKQSLGDAQVAYVVERFSSQIRAFVSWNAPHFNEKMSVPVMTPEQFLS